MPTVIYVSAYRIGRHVRGDAADDPITVEDADGHAVHGRAFRIDGPSIVRYDPAAAHPSGARCWVETDSPVEAITYEFVGNAGGLESAAAATVDALRSIERAASKTIEALGKTAQPKEST